MPRQRPGPDPLQTPNLLSKSADDFDDEESVRLA